MALFSSYTTRHIKSNSQGFSLLELIIVVTIVGVLFVALALVFNPAAQFSKADNAKRQHDLEEVRTALATYYDDTGCYPTSLSFAQKFSLIGKTYMQTIPEDPKCGSSGNNCYIYQTDTSTSCPQWNVLYDALAVPLPNNITCPLTSVSNNCVPTNYSQLGINYCVISGNIDCAKISSVAITPVPPAGGGTSGGGGGSGGSVVTPTPTPPTCSTYYACTGIGANGCNVLDSSSQQNCKVYGGNLVCYCDTKCSSQCQ